MDINATSAKLSGFGMQLLKGIDPNSENFVCAAILHTRTQQIGCLLRLEPNRQAQVSSTVLTLTHKKIKLNILIKLTFFLFKKKYSFDFFLNRCTDSQSEQARNP